ncbi:hypothetical protein JYU14_02045 [Simkania negevensis]|uniref:Uncharacterized protein n=1 Tax=Simkania negevensis TaxID=83561 RepID=A0ABS3AQR4_9BACT|nr:hypothetical protein [Simkania negevensis]
MTYRHEEKVREYLVSIPENTCAPSSFLTRQADAINALLRSLAKVANTRLGVESFLKDKGFVAEAFPSAAMATKIFDRFRACVPGDLTANDKLTPESRDKLISFGKALRELAVEVSKKVHTVQLKMSYSFEGKKRKYFISVLENENKNSFLEQQNRAIGALITHAKKTPLTRSEAETFLANEGFVSTAFDSEVVGKKILARFRQFFPDPLTEEEIKKLEAFRNALRGIPGEETKSAVAAFAMGPRADSNNSDRSRPGSSLYGGLLRPPTGDGQRPASTFSQLGAEGDPPSLTGTLRPGPEKEEEQRDRVFDASFRPGKD